MPLLNPFRSYNPYKGIEQALTEISSKFGRLNIQLTKLDNLDKLDKLIVTVEKLNTTLERMNKHMANIDQASQNLEALVSVGDGMALLLGTLNEEIAKLKTVHTDPETAQKIDALNAKIEENTAEWTAALVANTPAAEEPTE